MNAVQIQTANVTLVPQTYEEVCAMIEALSDSDKKHVSADWLARLHATAPTDPWRFGYSMVLRSGDRRIGDAGFKGPPTLDGVVEIAYGIATEFQGHGYATEAAHALTEFAFNSGLVRVVRAHTLPEPNASTRVLTKCGFQLVGDVVDPEDGLVWRWEKHTNASSTLSLGVGGGVAGVGVRLRETPGLPSQSLSPAPATQPQFLALTQH